MGDTCMEAERERDAEEKLRAWSRTHALCSSHLLIRVDPQHLKPREVDERDDRPPQQQQEKQNQQQHQNQQQQQNQLGKEEEKEVEVEEEQLSLETTGQQNQGDASDTLVAQWKDAFVDSCREYRHARTAADNGEDAEQFDEDAISFSELEAYQGKRDKAKR